MKELGFVDICIEILRISLSEKELEKVYIESKIFNYILFEL